MTNQEVKRKLTAILNADVKGYSRLMGEDEKGTVRTLNVYKEVMTGLIQQHRGRVVDAPGDNVLAEFGSVVDAVECAVEIQKELKTRNAELPENRRMEFRIGVNLGDVIEDGEQILGDGVNIAARLESLSEAGSICISGTAFDQVKNKLNLGYKYLGEQTVKNISEPVRVYRVLMEPEAAGKVIGEKKVKPKQWQRATIGFVAAVIVVVAAVAIWRLYLRPSTPPIEVASKEKMAFPLPDKPSIAIMPFVNMTGDPSQEFFCDGFSENLITALSKVPQLFVIARESTFSYKGKAVKVKQVAEELGVQYVVEGSVQRAGNLVRVTAQLIDALKGHHLWADRYDREWKELFLMQDEITKQIISALQVKITWGEISQVFARGTENLEAYMKAGEAIWYCSQGTIEGVNRARQLAQDAVALDPKYPTAFLALGLFHMVDAMLGLSKNRKESLELSNKMLQRALELDPSLTKARGILAFNLVMLSRHDEAVAEGERCYKLDPNSAAGLYWYGLILISVGKVEEAASLLKEALRLNPIPPNAYWRTIAIALRESGRYEEAIAYLKRAVEREPNDFLAYWGLAATYSMAGRMDEAHAAAKEVLRINPRITRHYMTFPIKDPVARERLAEALGKAGLPD
jgi:adenylate cyclase